MLLLISCLLVLGSVWAQPRATTPGTAHLRVSETDKFFYSGLDHRIVNGWSDERSINVQRQFGVVLDRFQNLAQVNFSEANSAWRIEASEKGYAAKEEDEIVFRIRAAPELNQNVSLTFFAGPAEDQEPIRQRILATHNQWRAIHIPLRALEDKPIELRAVGLRNENQGRATVYIAYMYLHRNEPAPTKDPKKKN